VSPKLNGSHQRALKLNIIVVGAGLGGLATAIALARKGHSVTVLEQASRLGEVGAGIQIPPNSSRLLLEWGLGPFLGDKTVEPEGISFRRWETGRVIGYTKLVPEFRKSFKAPYYVVHRAHFHDALYRRAIELGVNVLINHKTVEYNDAAPSVTLANGEVMTADFVVAADGVNSIARKKLTGIDKPPLKTGFAAYRATVDVAKMQGDPEVSWLLKKPGLNIWIGPERHVMTYTIAAGRSFNMVLSHVDHSDPSTWKPENAIKEMKEYFLGWDLQLNKVIDMIDKTLKWPLLTGDSLDKWVSDSSKLVVLGDAVHAMVPYMSQGLFQDTTSCRHRGQLLTLETGAAMAVEDGAALAEALSNVTAIEELKPALRIFENIRIKRADQMQQASLINGMLWHFPDGQIQQARDAAMQPEVEGREFEKSPNQWSDRATQTWAYGYDAVEEIREAFRIHSSV
jgi:salicylate hydroxylase